MSKKGACLMETSKIIFLWMCCSQMDANRSFISSECLIPSGENGHVDA